MTLILLILINITVLATSLWSEESADIYKDKEKEYQLGDIVTILIEESSDASHSANTSVNQGSNVKAGAGFGIFEFLSNFGFSYSDQDGSEGQTERSGSLTADITTTISEVLSNGNFKIEGTKTIKINGEKQIIKLSGIIRPEDISEENSVPSKKIADASIEFEGKGVVEAKQEPNIFQKILNWIF